MWRYFSEVGPVARDDLAGRVDHHDVLAVMSR